MYKFSYRRNGFWYKFKVIGHNYDTTQDKMAVYFEDGGVREIKHWKECEIRLGADWFVHKKKEMESQAGQKIPTTIGE